MDLSVLLQTWLSESPKYTVFRINKLMEYDDTNIQNVLKIQSKELNIEQIPKYYSIKPDCLVVEQWPPEVTVERSNKEVVVNSMCAAAVLRGAHVFAPAVLGLPTNCTLNESVDIFSDLDGQCKRGLKIEYNGRKQYVGTGYLKIVQRELFDNGIQPNGIAVEMLLAHSRLPVINESINPKGQLVLQNLPSIVTGWVLDAKAYEYILDMCAAPGNKTTHLAEMSNNCTAEKFNAMSFKKRISLLLILFCLPSLIKYMNISFLNYEANKKLVDILINTKSKRILSNTRYFGAKFIHPGAGVNVA